MFFLNMIEIIIIYTWNVILVVQMMKLPIICSKISKDSWSSFEINWSLRFIQNCSLLSSIYFDQSESKNASIKPPSGDANSFAILVFLKIDIMRKAAYICTHTYLLLNVKRKQELLTILWLKVNLILWFQVSKHFRPQLESPKTFLTSGRWFVSMKYCSPWIFLNPYKWNL